MNINNAVQNYMASAQYLDKIYPEDTMQSRKKKSSKLLISNENDPKKTCQELIDYRESIQKINQIGENMQLLKYQKKEYVEPVVVEETYQTIDVNKLVKYGKNKRAKTTLDTPMDTIQSKNEQDNEEEDEEIPNEFGYKRNYKNTQKLVEAEAKNLKNIDTIFENKKRVVEKKLGIVDLPLITNYAKVISKDVIGERLIRENRKQRQELERQRKSMNFINSEDYLQEYKNNIKNKLDKKLAEKIDVIAIVQEEMRQKAERGELDKDEDKKDNEKIDYRAMFMSHKYDKIDDDDNNNFFVTGHKSKFHF